MSCAELRSLAEKAVRDMPIPKSKRDLYPRIHATAYAIDWPNKAEAVGAVFQVICKAVCVEYGSQYMDRMLMIKLDDGSLEQGIRSIALQPMKNN